VLEGIGEEATTPNLSVPGGGPILDYLQRGEYLPRRRLLEQVAHILLMAHWMQLVYVGLGTISCGEYFEVFQNTYNYGLLINMLCCNPKLLNRKI
jgi:hypothetical protein